MLYLCVLSLPSANAFLPALPCMLCLQVSRAYLSDPGLLLGRSSSRNNQPSHVRRLLLTAVTGSNAAPAAGPCTSCNERTVGCAARQAIPVGIAAVLMTSPTAVLPQGAAGAPPAFRSNRLQDTTLRHKTHHLPPPPSTRHGAARCLGHTCSSRRACCWPPQVTARRD